MAMRPSRLNPATEDESAGAAATQPVRTAESEDSDPRITAPHKPDQFAPKFKSADGKKSYTPTNVRTAEWYARHGFKKA